jgi:hypothetical protein
MGCIYSETQLRTAIQNVPDYTATRIDLCSSYMPIKAVKQPQFQGRLGILIRRKILNIYCNVTGTDQCILDAKGVTRFFLVDQSYVTFHHITMMNGNVHKDRAYDSGGALYADFSTIVQ